MKLIAHRGLLEGPNKDLENKPVQIEHCLDNGYECEIDFWVNDSKFFLGHDRPTYEVSSNFLTYPGLWIHAKNIDALLTLNQIKNLNYFWHQDDDYTLTSLGYIWTYPGKNLTENSILVLPEWTDPSLRIVKETVCAGICSDFIISIEQILSI